MNLQHMRLDYEILNKSYEEIGGDVGLAPATIKTFADQGRWTRWFPEPDLVLHENGTNSLDEMEEVSENFMKRSAVRLKMYCVCKDILLASRYLALENGIIDKAIDLVEGMNLDSRDVKALSTLYKDMVSMSSLKEAVGTFQLGMDAGGLPTVIFKDLSGRK